MLISILIFSASGCANNGINTSDPVRAQKIVEEIAVDYGTYGA